MTSSLSIKPKHWGAFENPSIHSRSSILTPYILKATITLETGSFADRDQIWFVPAFFIELNSGYNPVGAEPQTGYFIEIPSDIAFPSTYEVPLKSKSGQAKLVNYNRSCSITFTSSTVAELLLEFTFLADRNQYLNDTVYNAREMALKSSTFSANELLNDIPSVYTRTVDLGAYFYYKSYDDNLEAEFSDEELVLQSRFYNEGLRINPTTKIDSQYLYKKIEIRDENGTRVSELNPYSKFEIKVIFSAIDAPVNGILYLFPNQTLYEDTQPVHQELPLLEIPIIERTGTAPVANGVYEPTTGFVANGSDYEFTFNVNGADLNLNTSYFIAAVIANDNYSNTILIPNLKNGNRPSQYPELPEFFCHAADYHGQGGSHNQKATVVDRYSVVFGFDADAHEREMQNFDFTNGSALEDIRGVQVQIVDAVTSEVYETAKALFQSNSLISTDKDLSIASLIPNPVFNYNLRNLFQNEQNFRNYGDRPLKAIASIEMGYNKTQDQVFYQTECTLPVRDFDNTKDDALIVESVFVDPSDDSPVLDMATYTKRFVKIISTIDTNNARIATEYVWKHHVFTDPYPFGINSINDQQLKGQQQYQGDYQQESNAFIVEQDEDFDPSTFKATAIIDLDLIDLSLAQKIYIVAKPLPEYTRGNPIKRCETLSTQIALAHGNYNEDLEKYIGTEDFRFTQDTARWLGRPDTKIEFDNFYEQASNNYAFQSQNPATVIPFVIFIGIKRQGNGNAAKAEIIEVDPDGVETVVATTGTNSNNGPFQPEVNETFDPQWYLIDDPDTNLPMPSRINEFETEWGVHFFHYGVQTRAPEESELSDCEYTLQQQRLRTQELESKGFQPVWFAYDPDKIEQGYDYYLRFRGTAEVINFNRDGADFFNVPQHYISASMPYCNYTSRCNIEPNSDFMEGEYGVYFRHEFSYSALGGEGQPPNTGSQRMLGQGDQDDFSQDYEYDKNRIDFNTENGLSQVNNPSTTPPLEHKQVVDHDYGATPFQPKSAYIQLFSTFRRFVEIIYPTNSSQSDGYYIISSNSSPAADPSKTRILVEWSFDGTANATGSIQLIVYSGADINLETSPRISGGTVIFDSGVSGNVSGSSNSSHDVTLTKGSRYQIVVLATLTTGEVSTLAYDYIAK
jgi:hypothetical protein